MEKQLEQLLQQVTTLRQDIECRFYVDTWENNKYNFYNKLQLFR